MDYFHHFSLILINQTHSCSAFSHYYKPRNHREREREPSRGGSCLFLLTNQARVVHVTLSPGSCPLSPISSAGEVGLVLNLTWVLCSLLAASEPASGTPLSSLLVGFSAIPELQSSPGIRGFLAPSRVSRWAIRVSISWSARLRLLVFPPFLAAAKSCSRVSLPSA